LTVEQYIVVITYIVQICRRHTLLYAFLERSFGGGTVQPIPGVALTVTAEKCPVFFVIRKFLQNMFSDLFPVKNRQRTAQQFANTLGGQPMTGYVKKQVITARFPLVFL